MEIENKESQELSPGVQALILLGVGLYLLYRLFKHDPFSFMHHLYLPIHEAGHLFFTPFGEFIYFLGGSFFQVFFPFCFTLSFAWRQDYFASLITLIWVGDSIIDVSFYIGDAYKQQLPLIGGEHDWAYLLGELDWVHHADLLGSLSWWWGALVMLSGFIGALFYANQRAGWIQIRS